MSLWSNILLSIKFNRPLNKSFDENALKNMLLMSCPHSHYLLGSEGVVISFTYANNSWSSLDYKIDHNDDNFKYRKGISGLSIIGNLRDLDISKDDMNVYQNIFKEFDSRLKLHSDNLSNVELAQATLLNQYTDNVYTCIFRSEKFTLTLPIITIEESENDEC